MKRSKKLEDELSDLRERVQKTAAGQRVVAATRREKQETKGLGQLLRENSPAWSNLENSSGDGEGESKAESRPASPRIRSNNGKRKWQMQRQRWRSGGSRRQSQGRQETRPRPSNQMKELRESVMDDGDDGYE